MRRRVAGKCNAILATPDSLSPVADKPQLNSTDVSIVSMLAPFNAEIYVVSQAFKLIAESSKMIRPGLVVTITICCGQEAQRCWQ